MFLHYFNKKRNNLKKTSDLIYKDIFLISNNFMNNYFSIKELNFNLKFEIFSIITVFYLKKLKDINASIHQQLSQNIINYLINDLDKTLREQGIGDMSIGKYVKKFVKKFYYRLKILDLILNDKNEFNFVEYLIKFEISGTENSKKMSQDLVKIYNNLKIIKL